MPTALPVFPDLQRLATCVRNQLSRLLSPGERTILTILLLFCAADPARRARFVAELRHAAPALARLLAPFAPEVATRHRPRTAMAARARLRRLRRTLRRRLPHPRPLPAPAASARAPPPPQLRCACLTDRSVPAGDTG